MSDLVLLLYVEVYLITVAVLGWHAVYEHAPRAWRRVTRWWRRQCCAHGWHRVKVWEAPSGHWLYVSCVDCAMTEPLGRVRPSAECHGRAA